MPTKAQIMAMGQSAPVAQLLGYDNPATIASAGTNQATATPLVGNCAIVTGTGWVRLPPAGNSGPVVLLPQAAATVCANGNDVINGLAVGAGLVMTANRAQYLVPAGQQWFALGSAN